MASFRALRGGAAAFLFSLAVAASGQPLAPDIVVVKTINAPVAEVWKAWTTSEGIESFFAPKAVKVEPWPGGAFELWFGVNLPEGSRGCEGCKVHSVRPLDLGAWDMPTRAAAMEMNIHGIHGAGDSLIYFVERREDLSIYDVDFKPLPGSRTEVTLRNFGYGDGDDWVKTKAYFQTAWNNVMASLEKRFAAK